MPLDSTCLVDDGVDQRFWEMVLSDTRLLELEGVDEGGAAPPIRRRIGRGTVGPASLRAAWGQARQAGSGRGWAPTSPPPHERSPPR
jgi:hypothetical protein